MIPDDLPIGLRNRSGKHIRQSEFARQMEYLSRAKVLISMSDIEQAAAEQRPLPAGSVAVTFDDGFYNNFAVAWPTLEEFSIPATFYLATGFIGADRVIWSDRLEQAFLSGPPRVIHFSANGNEYRFDIADNDRRVEAFLTTKAVCKTLSHAERSRLVGELEGQHSPIAEADKMLYGFMNWENAQEMNRSGLVEFGAHTIDHIPLTQVSRSEMKHQVSESMKVVRQYVPGRHPLFSYPEGQSSDFDSEVIDYLISLGLRHCPTAIDGNNDVDLADPFRLRRSMVGFEGRAFPFLDEGQK